MAAVTESVVREYFEALGYLVSQPRKYVLPGKPKTAEEEIDFVIENPRITKHEITTNTLLWTTEDFSRVARAVVGVVGWHTDRFYARTFDQEPEILRFARPRSIRYAERMLGSTAIAKVLCLPRLPASKALLEKSLTVLKRRGVDGVVTFDRMLVELVFRTDTKRNYEKSDILQVIRLLKIHGLLSNDQLELFAPRRRRKG